MLSVKSFLRFRFLFPAIRSVSNGKLDLENQHKHVEKESKEMFTISDLVQNISQGKELTMKYLTKVLNRADFSILSNQHAMLVIQCFSDAPDSSRELKDNLCQHMFKQLMSTENFDINLYNCYLKACNKNKILVNYNDFLQSLKCEPNDTTYKLLLENVCQVGNLEDALSLLEKLKEKGIPVDINIFNQLIMAHTIQGGLKLTDQVLKIMRTAQLMENNETKLSILRGLIKRQDFKEFTEAIELYNYQFNEDDFLIILQELGDVAKEDWLPNIQHLYKDIFMSRELLAKIENICVQLVHQNQPKTAINIYENFIKPVSEVPYALKVFQQMLYCKTDIAVVIELAEQIESKGLNNYILRDLTGLALKWKHIDSAWALLDKLKCLKLHYFWPLLVYYGNKDSKNGVFYVLKQIQHYNIQLDEETLEYFILPYSDVSNLDLLISKFQDVGVVMKIILSPLILNLLRKNKVEIATKLCDQYNVPIAGDKIIQELPKSWLHTKKSILVVDLLKKLNESTTNKDDIIGGFLYETYNICVSERDFKDLYELIELLAKSNLTISSYYAEIIQSLLGESDHWREKFTEAINSILDLTKQVNEDVVLTHPKDMDINSLECHLVELEEKNMNTRGVLRRLIQCHTKNRNTQRVMELEAKMADVNYGKSTGVKSNIMHLFILEEKIENALNCYNEIKHSDPNFRLDSFKIIDLATLLVKCEKFEEALNILQSENITSNTADHIKSIERNCRELLSACKTPEQIDTLFNLLLQKRLCRPTNVVMGPLVRIHLNSGNIQKATETYTKLAEKYKCTPLQLEILCSALKQGNEGMLQQILVVTEEVHGVGGARIGLISALAESNKCNELKKVLSETTIFIRPLLHKRCHRWVKEKKLKPLMCLAKACEGLPDILIDRNVLYKCIFDIYNLTGDYKEAIDFYESLSETYFFQPILTKYIDKLKSSHKTLC